MPQEVVLTSSSSPDSQLLIHNLHTSALVQTFRQSSTQQNGLIPTPSHSHFLSTQPEKGLIHIYSWGHDTPASKMILPDKVRCLCLSPSGKWCAGGSESGRVFLWEVPEPPLGEALLLAEWFLVGEWEFNVCEGGTLPSINTFMFLC
jgi:WD40 repeat protein